MNKYIRHGFFCFVTAIILVSGCKKFITIDPPFTSTSTDQVYSKDATAAASLTAIYTQMSQADVIPGQGITSVSIDAGLYADELDYVSPINNTNNYLWTNQLTPVDGLQNDWNRIYNSIYETSAAIEGLKSSSTLTPAVKQQLLGEAMFLRGFFYFYLVNFFGDVPLALSTDYKVNSLLSRAPQEKVYNQIISDLQAADSLLNVDYMGGDAHSLTSERVRPSKAAAETMLARVYLYQKDYPEAESFATKVISNTGSYGLVSLDSVFLKNNRETIWSIPSVKTGAETNTAEGRAFLLSATTNNLNGPAYNLTEALLNTFEPGDQRKAKWTAEGTAQNNQTFQFAYKYKIGRDPVPTIEYSMVLRLAELYLIRSEARAMQNNITEAQQDLNAIRHRAGLSNTTASTQDALVTAILHERRVELFTEWGHRFFDLKRLGKLDAVLSTEKPQWNTDDQYFPIPKTERDRDPNLSQNPGYTD